jgi:integrase
MRFAPARCDPDDRRALSSSHALPGTRSMHHAILHVRDARRRDDLDGLEHRVADAHVGASTINRKLSALAAFYSHQARHGVDVGELLSTWQLPGRRGGWKPFLHHISKGGRGQPRRAIVLKVASKLPRVLTVTEMQAILDACERLRDRFLFSLLYDSGVRIGEALGLRHEDIRLPELLPACVLNLLCVGKHGR